ncbi:MAG: alpha-glucosidase [Flavobacteriaceae bacterium]|nr:alpha-glucosidase [Flavobacteriaceae bacterium]
MTKTWWKESVIYQIYPKSYNDATGNGVGDLLGIIQKLDYIKSLGVDMIWLCPIYESPDKDNGYDISDYKNISEKYGGNDVFEEFLTAVHEKGMKLMMDLVLNHTSDQHYWFKESRKSKTNKYRDYYFWKTSANGEPPTNWPSFFSGNAWQYDETTKEYYLHLFTKEQPDLNWENPEVRKELHDIMEYWLKKGVDGFRFDVVSLISKGENFSNTELDDFNDIINKHYANGPKVHQYLRELNANVLSKYGAVTVGEGPGIDLENGPLYVDEDREELNMIFHFGHMFIDAGAGGKYDIVPFDLLDFKKVFNDWDTHLRDKGWGSIFLGNHDFSRMVSRFGNDGEFRMASAKLLATLLFTMRGTVFVYQGDEIGMTNVAFPSIEDYNDVETINSWNEAEHNGEDMDEFLKKVHTTSRDNARTPMQWNTTKNAGFSAATPWLKVNPNYTTINVAEQENDPDSILNYYRSMIAFRKKHLTFVYGNYECLDFENEHIYAFRRWDDNADFLVLLNFSDKELRWKNHLAGRDYELVKSNLTTNTPDATLKPWQAKILKLKS